MMKLIQSILALCFVLCLSGLAFAQSDAPGAADSPNAAAQSALFRVAELGQTDAVSELLKQGADINARNEKGETALMLAAIKGRAETVKSFLEFKADRLLQANNGETALTLATRNGHLKVVETILGVFRNHFSINLQNQDGKTALILAIENGRSDIASVLIDARANPNLRDTNGVTALMMAVRMNNLYFVKKLLEVGATVSIPDNTRDNAVLIAERNGYGEIKKLLVESAYSGNHYIKPWPVLERNEFPDPRLLGEIPKSIHVKFMNRTSVRLRKGKFVSKDNVDEEIEQLKLVNDIFARYQIVLIRRGSPFTEEEAENRKRKREREKRREYYDSNLDFILVISHLTTEELVDLFESLKAIEIIESVRIPMESVAA